MGRQISVRSRNLNPILSILLMPVRASSMPRVSYFYRPQTKFAKVMFLHVSVILSTGGACMVAPGGGVCGCSAGVRGCSGGMHCCSGGVHGCSRGGMCGCSGGHAWLLPGGACVGYDEILRYGQWAGSTHPTGMHSCSCLVSLPWSFPSTKLHCVLFASHWTKRLSMW